MTTYNNETYRIDDIDENSDPDSQFEKKDGSKMSYTQYYKEVCVFQFKIIYLTINILFNYFT